MRITQPPCTPAQLQEEAEALFGGSLSKLEQFLQERVARSDAEAQRNRVHLQADLETVHHMQKEPHGQA